METAIKTLHRVVVVLPPKIDSRPGFGDAIRAIKLMASRLAADVLFYVVGPEHEQIAARVDRVRQKVRRSFEPVPDWRSLREQLQRTATDDQLFVLVSDRPGMDAWDEELNRIPRRLVNFARNVCVVYPSTIEPTEERDDHVRTLLNEALQAGRLAVGLEDVGMEAAVEMLLESEFGEDGARLLEATTALAPTLADGVKEVAPGVVLVLAQMDELASPLLFLGLNKNGIAMRGATEPARVVAIVLAPTGHRKSVEAYAEELWRQLCSPERVEQLAGCTSLPSVAQFFRPEKSGRGTRAA
jgi:hypothetical protein